MTEDIIVSLLGILSRTAVLLAPLLAEGKAVLSETDAAKIHDALLQAEAATAALRPQVDAALAAAAKQ